MLLSIFSVITVASIHNGNTYLSNHLRANDYWEEGQKVEGEWIGEAAEQLGLSGAVEDSAFEALREARHPNDPKTRLLVREKEGRIAFHDIQLSAPKDVSVLALVGNDPRVLNAFKESVKATLIEMEKFAAARVREGEFAHTEELRRTGNMATALFFHDASRELDPQLHAHAVTANLTWDEKKGEWTALQRREMLEASKFARRVLYGELASRLHALGYETHSHDGNGFAVAGVEHLRERFSKRAALVATLKEAFKAKEGREPSAKETAVIVKESRADKMTEISTPEVRKAQRGQLTSEEAQALDELVERAQAHQSSPLPPTLSASEAITMGLESALERSSVTPDYEVLEAALKLTPDYVPAAQLRAALNAHPDVEHRGSLLTTRQIMEEEYRAIRFALEGKGTKFPLGRAESLPPELQGDSREAAERLLSNRDSVAVLIGDAGTGKTFLLKNLQAAHISDGGEEFFALAPMGKAANGLRKDGFKTARTVAFFLKNEKTQQKAAGRVIMVDEAGTLGTVDQAKLIAIADRIGARLLLVGDTKQHESVTRGNSLRNIIEGGKIEPARLSQVKRQKNEEDRRFSEALASGQHQEAFEMAEKSGKIIEEKNEELLFRKAAADYADALKEGRDKLVVIPVWSEIHVFNEEARTALKERGVIHGQEIEKNAVKSLSWTVAEKKALHLYRPGMALTFHKGVKGVEKGETLRVLQVEKSHLVTEKPNGQTVIITIKQAGAFDVGEAHTIQVAAGDKILFRANEHGYSTGDVVTIEQVANDGSLKLADGKTLPATFSQFTYGHAVTSHKSQGASVSESLLVMGGKSILAANAAQFYVSNTRFKTSHTLYLANSEALKGKLRNAKKSVRELAKEWLTRTEKARGVLWDRVERIAQNIPTKERNILNHIMDYGRRIKEKIERIQLALKTYEQNRQLNQSQKRNI